MKTKDPKFPFIRVVLALITVLAICFIVDIKIRSKVNVMMSTPIKDPVVTVEMIDKKLDILREVFVLENRWPAGLKWPGEVINEFE